MDTLVEDGYAALVTCQEDKAKVPCCREKGFLIRGLGLTVEQSKTLNLPKCKI